MVYALLPLKDFAFAKQRLSSVLTADERCRLFHAMVEDVLSVLAVHPNLEQTIIVSDDPGAELLARRYDVIWWSESSLDVSQTDLSSVVQASAEKLERQGVSSMVVVHGDLPFLKQDDIKKLVNQHRALLPPALTIAPDTCDNGSNCLQVSPPNAIRFAYGKDSYSKHLAMARSQQVNASRIYLSGASRDIDTVEDLDALLAGYEPGAHTRRYLNTSGIAMRLANRASRTHESTTLTALVEHVLSGNSLSHSQALLLAKEEFYTEDSCALLMATASRIRDRGFRNLISYSRKVFIPLTQLCRDVCHYCTFAQTPKKNRSPYMSVDEVLESVRVGVEQGCKEALFTLGERPEYRYRVARDALNAMGFESTLDYVAHVAEIVFRETGVLPHINAGCLSENEIALLRPVSASMGLMLESASPRLCEKGLPHYGSIDKEPWRRIQTLELAGKSKVPTTSGILIGIGETRLERIESLLVLRDLHLEYGHLQEIIIQNFKAKPQTKMAQSPEPNLYELLWTIAVARIIFGPEMSIQAPPNLSPGVLPKIIDAGINDWGGVSPVTPDYVNPEAPWPHLRKLAAETKVSGKHLIERLTIYPAYAIDGKRWLDENLRTAVLRMIDTEGFPRSDSWCPGTTIDPPVEILQQLSATALQHVSPDINQIVASARAGNLLSEPEVVRLFQARGDDLSYVCQQADKIRQRLKGDTVTYVVNRNINYTNICFYKCQFCAFSKGKLSDNLRGRPYNLSREEIQRRSIEAWNRGATEVCMQGGIHPDYTGNTYRNIIDAVKTAVPDLHIHAFSPLEVFHGAETLGVSLSAFLEQLRSAGLNTLPGTAAEILDDEVRAELCPDKINTRQWLSVMEEAHQLGIKTTATIMYGHIEKIEHWAKHLLLIRTLQEYSGGFTEFVPLPFVHMEAPMYLKGRARMGPTFRESVLMHAVARIVLSPCIENIQTSWVKMGEKGVVACLRAGANDLGGTLMNETITRAAGAAHGQEFSPGVMERVILSADRYPKQRNTLYSSVPVERIKAACNAIELVDVVNTPAVSRRKYINEVGEDACLFP